MMAPSKIGRYLVKAELQRGGMSTVYRAYDPRFEREVAVKVLPRELLVDDEFRVRFEREAKTLASLEHPAIVPVYDFGEEDGRLYLVMRYMPGGSLADRMAHGPLSPSEAARILTRLAPALDEAHAKGIIHRDLKPANILFDQRGEPYLSDFGVVKLPGVKTTTSGRVAVGTPAYMSPEQARGEPNLDSRSDIYAMGAVLFEMLSGRLPYEADTAAGQLVRRLMDPVPNILALKPDLPPRTQEVIDRALAKRAYVRFGSASELARAFRAVLRDNNPAPSEAVKPSEPPLPASGNGANGVKQAPPSLFKKPPKVRPTITRPERKPSRWMYAGIVLSLLVIAGGLVSLAAFFLPDGWLNPNRSANLPAGTAELGIGGLEQPSATPASPDIFASVLDIQGVAQLLEDDLAPVILNTGDEIPVDPALRIWSTSGLVRLGLSGGALLIQGDNTITNPAGPLEGTNSLALESGQALVSAAALLVRTDQPGLRVRIENGMAGIYYEPALGRFQVDCLAGACILGENGEFILSAGQRLAFEGGIPGAVEPARYELWTLLGGADVPTPTVTPTPTATLAPTATPTPQSTATPVATLYVAPTQAVLPTTVVVPTNTSPPPAPTRTSPPPAPTPTPTESSGIG